jgi:hypothetical protein
LEQAIGALKMIAHFPLGAQFGDPLSDDAGQSNRSFLKGSLAADYARCDFRSVKSTNFFTVDANSISVRGAVCYGWRKKSA